VHEERKAIQYNRLLGLTSFEVRVLIAYHGYRLTNYKQWTTTLFRIYQQ